MTERAAASLSSASQIVAGRYQLQRLLGRGGMSSVYAALDTVTGQELALKQLGANASPEVRELFELEYHTLVSLRHPNIVQALDYGTSADGAFYTMELLEGSDLSRSAPMPWREVCTCLRDAASVMGVLHARNLVHRDISPRNLWRTPEGRLKLIDFGTLAPFGKNRIVVGTVPFMSPEAVSGGALDQRSDLFALGALGYWLCTGVHAFSAQHASELPRLHARTPTAPSQLMPANVNTADPVPEALDNLLLGLLKQDPNDRPQSAGELVERLHALTEIAPEESAGHVRGYIASKAFVGRGRERANVANLLRAAAQSSFGVRVLAIEAADAGLGRTRLLRELAMLAQLRGVIAVSACASPGAPPLACASRWARALLDDPRLAERVRPEREALQALMPDRSSAGASNPSAVSAAIQALTLAASREHTIALFVDDVHIADEASQALLATLALASAPARLVIVVSLRLTADVTGPALHSLRNAAHTLKLPPLTEPEVLALLRSVFGPVPYLERLAQRLHQASAGNPAHCLEIAEFLIEAGEATYGDGTWTLPTDLDAARLPSRREVHMARLARLPASARELLRLLSIPHWGPLTLEQCQVLTGVSREQALQVLSQLCQANVLRELGSGYGFVHRDVQLELASTLSAQEAEQAHLRLARSLSESMGDELQPRLLTSLHYLYAGELRTGVELFARTWAPYEDRQAELPLRGVTQIIEAAYLQLKKMQAPAHALAWPAPILAFAGYFIDRRYGSYGGAALEVGEEVLRLDVFRRFRGVVGRKPALLMALGASALGARAHRSYAVPLSNAVARHLAVASSLTALAATAADRPTATRFADAIEPFSALGRDHAATFSYDFAQYIARQCSDHIALHYRDALQLRSRLLATPGPRGLMPAVKAAFLTGTEVMLMLQETWRESPEAMVLANRIEKASPLHKLYADAVRFAHCLRLGDVESSESARRRIELHAVELDSAWQTESWGGSLEAINIALQLRDATRMKRAVADLIRLCPQLPSLSFLLARARGHYQILRGNYARGIQLLDTNEEPMACCGWAQTRGMLAGAHNALGEHARAREICMDALARLSPEDLDFVVLNLGVQVELALAEAGLGNVELAAGQLDALINAHTSVRGALTLGTLHEARAKVALRAGDILTCRVQLARMTDYFRPMGLSSLRERIEQLERRLRFGVAQGGAFASLRPQEFVSDALRQLSSDPGQTLFDCAQKCLELAIEGMSASTGFLLLTDADDPIIQPTDAEPLASELSTWARERLRGEDDDEATMIEVEGPITVPQTWTGGQQTYRFSPLVAVVNSRPQLIGALVLGYQDAAPKTPPARFLQGVAEALSHPLGAS